MTNKTLTIIESAYRATIEEQDDTVVWITQAMKGAGGDFTVLLRGNAVNYAVANQEVAGLELGDWKQTHPPRVQHDVAALIGKGVEVYVVEDDLQERGIERTDLIPNLKMTNKAGIAKLMNDHDRIWHW
jgi:sulfur relay (sulfurtransferase) DsrF/TusC family protein